MATQQVEKPVSYNNNTMQIKWTRGHDEIKFTRPDMTFCLGMRGSGKSTFLESVGEGFLRAGNGVLDLFGSRDGESLAWLRCPWSENKKIL